MPPHSTYIESHLGGGSVLCNKKAAQTNIGVDLDPQVLARWRLQNFKQLILIEADAATYLNSYPFTGEELVYADPPYLPHTRRRSRVYRYDYTLEDHQVLLDVLAALPCKVMLSGYDSSLYGERLADWHKCRFRAKTHTEVREECLWFNFEPPHELHDGRYLGHSYRERQTVRRRHSRLFQRFDRMPDTERRYLLDQLTSRFADEPESAS